MTKEEFEELEPFLDTLNPDQQEVISPAEKAFRASQYKAHIKG